MKKILIVTLLAITAGLLAACSGERDSGIVPAEDRLTFIYFYTDG